MISTILDNVSINKIQIKANYYNQKTAYAYRINFPVGNNLSCTLDTNVALM